MKGFGRVPRTRGVTTNQGAGILIVDAEEESRATVEKALETLGRELFLAASGIDALEQLADHWIALALIALELPGIDGLAVVKKIERDRPEVQVLVLTRDDSPDAVEECLRHGALEVMRKPVSAEHVRSAASSALGLDA